jgi:N-dimethylarginine dimethylaminohydrolase
MKILTFGLQFWKISVSKFEEMESSMTDEQFIIQILNSLTEEYELQIRLLEKRIVDMNTPLTIQELKEELTLRFERMTSKTDSAILKGSFDKRICLWGISKGNAAIVGR